MYKIFLNKKSEKALSALMKSRKDIKDKLDRLKENPYKSNGAHPLHGKLKGKWVCWLGSNIRMIYIIEEENKIISVDAIGSHNLY